MREMKTKNLKEIQETFKKWQHKSFPISNYIKCKWFIFHNQKTQTG